MISKTILKRYNLVLEDSKTNRLTALKNANSDLYYKDILDSIVKNALEDNGFEISPNSSLAENYCNYCYENLLENIVESLESEFYEENGRAPTEEEIEEMTEDYLDDESVFKNTLDNLDTDINENEEMGGVFGDDQNFVDILKRYLKNEL
jgi:hypothetical protein